MDPGGLCCGPVLLDAACSSQHPTPSAVGCSLLVALDSRCMLGIAVCALASAQANQAGHYCQLRGPQGPPSARVQTHTSLSSTPLDRMWSDPLSYQIMSPPSSPTTHPPSTSLSSTIPTAHTLHHPLMCSPPTDVLTCSFPASCTICHHAPRLSSVQVLGKLAFRKLLNWRQKMAELWRKHEAAEKGEDEPEMVCAHA